MTKMGGLTTAYEQFLTENSDPKVSGWKFCDGIGPTFHVTVLYLFFVKVLGPMYMEKRKAYSLTKIIAVYNVFQVCFNFFIFYNAVKGYFTGENNVVCQTVTKQQTTRSLSEASAVWYFYVSKIIDFADSMFLILRKKDNQLSFLHIFHHASMPFSSWVGLKFAPGGNTLFVVSFNSFVHVVMYSYYFLASLGPALKPYLWWKRYLTTFQIFQFVMVFLNNLALQFVSCDFPRFVSSWYVFKSIAFFVLFFNFYLHAYSKKQVVRKPTEDLKQNGHEKHM